jgi:predicted enzyme related to lactoylglutathione lyase
MPKTEIPTVGWLIQFTNREGNVVSAMKYDDTAR